MPITWKDVSAANNAASNALYQSGMNAVSAALDKAAAIPLAHKKLAEERAIEEANRVALRAQASTGLNTGNPATMNAFGLLNSAAADSSVDAATLGKTAASLLALNLQQDAADTQRKQVEGTIQHYNASDAVASKNADTQASQVASNNKVDESTIKVNNQRADEIGENVKGQKIQNEEASVKLPVTKLLAGVQTTEAEVQQKNANAALEVAGKASTTFENAAQLFNAPPNAGVSEDVRNQAAVVIREAYSKRLAAVDSKDTQAINAITAEFQNNFPTLYASSTQEAKTQQAVDNVAKAFKLPEGTSSLPSKTVDAMFTHAASAPKDKPIALNAENLIKGVPNPPDDAVRIVPHLQMLQTELGLSSAEALTLGQAYVAKHSEGTNLTDMDENTLNDPPADFKHFLKQLQDEGLLAAFPSRKSSSVAPSAAAKSILPDVSK